MKLRLSALAACLLLSATAAHADGYTVRDGSGVLKTLASKFVGLVHHPLHVMEGLFGGVPTAVTMTNAGALDVTVVAGGSGTSLTKSSAADPTMTEGVTTNQVSVDLSGYARSLAKQTGTWNITNVSGTVSLPTGASTAANQTTGNTSLATIATNTGSNATAANQASVIGTKAAGTAATNSILTGGTFNTSLPTLTNGQQASIQLDSSARQIVVCASGCSGGTQFAEDSVHASGDLGTFALVVRSDTAASTAGTTGDYTAMITDATGHLWTHGVAVASDFADGWDVTQGAKADSAWTTGSGSVIALLKAMATAALDTTPSPVKIDQTTPGTTNHVDAGLSAATTGGCTPYGLASAASTNSTNIKASAGTLCSLGIINTTATLYYVRLYNAASAPTCSSATNFVLSIPVPASATGAGTNPPLGTFGWAFTTGISFCLTGGGSSTDNTNAATGVYLAASYK